MASRFMRGLAKIGMVEIDESAAEEAAGEALTMEEIDRIIAEEEAAGRAAPSPASLPASAPGSAAPGGIGAIAEGEGFAQIYQGAKIPESAYSADKLLRVLDGLKAMGPQVRKAAVMAMDAADDEWSVADAVLDAQRKAKALTTRGAQLSEQLTGIQTRAEQGKQKRDEYLDRAREQILGKITDLQNQLETETKKMLTEKTEIDSAVFAAQQAHQRESHRLTTEVDRLAEIPQIFAIQRGGTGEAQ